MAADNTVSRSLHDLGRFTVSFHAQYLMHPFFPKIVDQRSFFQIEVSANDCQVLPHRSMRKKLPDERIPIAHSFSE